MEAKYEAEKKELEIERQQQIIIRQNLQRWLLMAGIAICVLFLALLWYILNLRNRRNHELAEINLSKDKFFSIISHDLKNPAIAQRNTLQTLVKNARSWDADTLADYHSELLKSAEGELELIYNLLSWSQLQSGRLICSPETFPLSDLLPNLSLIRKMAENKNITFDIHIPENMLITADSHFLITVLRNLLTNAIKFTASGGTVTLDIAPCDGRDVACHVSTTEKYTISITDTGIGMSQEHIRTLFRLGAAHSHQGTAGEQGSGLGLIVCKELIEKHGSTLHVESKKGEGSKLWFTVS
jgi:signal transduction histidine kinase